MGGCSANNCKNRTEQGFVLLRFPRDEVRRKKWCEAVDRPGWSPTAANRLCETHFTRDQWEKYRCRLKPDAVPSLFNNRKAVKQASSTICPTPPAHSDHNYSRCMWKVGGAKSVELFNCSCSLCKTSGEDTSMKGNKHSKNKQSWSDYICTLKENIALRNEVAGLAKEILVQRLSS